MNKKTIKKLILISSIIFLIIGIGCLYKGYIIGIKIEPWGVTIIDYPFVNTGYAFLTIAMILLIIYGIFKYRNNINLVIK